MLAAVSAVLNPPQPVGELRLCCCEDVRPSVQNRGEVIAGFRDRYGR